MTVKVKDEKALAAEGFGGIVGVGQGAEHPPRLIELRYAPKGATGEVVLVGKGITFDSGGLSLKPPDSMKTMKTDMSGAAAVLATMSVLADLEVKVPVTGYLASAENMPSGKATRPGDVLTMKNGKTVEVLNTDAEGRLVMADALALGAASKPAAIVDVATLTGACAVALGNRYTGLMANDEALAAELLDAAAEAGEPTWRLPLPPEYRKDIESDLADLKNVGDRYGGALFAGLFLQEFVDDRPWAHLDIAGPARAESDDGYLSKGSTGVTVRTLLTWLERRSRRRLGSGPGARTRLTATRAERSSRIQSASWVPTSRTHQARASLRLRATPASIRVSRTRRSGSRSRVITGTLRVVNSRRSPPQSTPQETLRR